MDNVIKFVTEKIEELVDNSAIFLVDVKIKPTNNIKVFLDGDAGITIDAVSKVNRALYAQIEEAAIFPDGDFSLEVSSPGVDEPLKFFRQYKKNLGRKVEVTLNDETKVTGMLKDATETEVTIEEVIGKKKEVQEKVIPFETILKTIVQISF